MTIPKYRKINHLEAAQPRHRQGDDTPSDAYNHAKSTSSPLDATVIMAALGSGLGQIHRGRNRSFLSFQSNGMPMRKVVRPPFACPGYQRRRERGLPESNPLPGTISFVVMRRHDRVNGTGGC